MELSPQLEAILDARVADALNLLRKAVSVDVYRCVFGDVDGRLRKRPHFLARTPPQALAQLRSYMRDRCEATIGDLDRMIRDLRVFYGGVPTTREQEDAGLGKAMATIEDLAREILSTWSMPGDDKPDRVDDRAVDLDPGYDLTYEPSPAVWWAWQNVRGVDRARFQIDDATRLPLERTLEVSCYLPEALPADTSEPPTIG
jgi:hypothetical protein